MRPTIIRHPIRRVKFHISLCSTFGCCAHSVSKIEHNLKMNDNNNNSNVSNGTASARERIYMDDRFGLFMWQTKPIRSMLSHSFDSFIHWFVSFFIFEYFCDEFKRNWRAKLQLQFQCNISRVGFLFKNNQPLVSNAHVLCVHLPFLLYCCCIKSSLKLSILCVVVGLCRRSPFNADSYEFEHLLAFVASSSSLVFSRLVLCCDEQAKSVLNFDLQFAMRLIQSPKPLHRNVFVEI